MSDYSYFTGSGVTLLDPATPVGQQEAATIVDDAIRQIKGYLRDTEVGPAALLTALEADIAAVSLPSGNLPTGVIVPYALGSTPADYYSLNGGTFLSSAAPALATLLSTTFGSAPAGSVKLPDARGRVIAGLKAGEAGYTVISDAGITGVYTHGITVPELPIHTHTLPDGKEFMDDSANTWGFNNYGSRPQIGVFAAHDISLRDADVHDNVQPTAAVNLLIKT